VTKSELTFSLSGIIIDNAISSGCEVAIRDPELESDLRKRAAVVAEGDDGELIMAFIGGNGCLEKAHDNYIYTVVLVPEGHPLLKEDAS